MFASYEADTCMYSPHILVVSLWEEERLCYQHLHRTLCYPDLMLSRDTTAVQVELRSETAQKLVEPLYSGVGHGLVAAEPSSPDAHAAFTLCVWHAATLEYLIYCRG